MIHTRDLTIVDLLPLTQLLSFNFQLLATQYARVQDLSSVLAVFEAMLI